MNNIASRVGLVFLLVGAALTLWYLAATPSDLFRYGVREALKVDAVAIEAELGQAACAGGMATVCLCCAAFLFGVGAIADAIRGKG